MLPKSNFSLKRSFPRKQTSKSGIRTLNQLGFLWLLSLPSLKCFFLGSLWVFNIISNPELILGTLKHLGSTYHSNYKLFPFLFNRRGKKKKIEPLQLSIKDFHSRSCGRGFKTNVFVKSKPWPLSLETPDQEFGYGNQKDAWKCQWVELCNDFVPVLSYWLYWSCSITAKFLTAHSFFFYFQQWDCYTNLVKVMDWKETYPGEICAIVSGSLLSNLVQNLSKLWGSLRFSSKDHPFLCSGQDQKLCWPWQTHKGEQGLANTSL